MTKMLVNDDDSEMSDSSYNSEMSSQSLSAEESKTDV